MGPILDLILLFKYLFGIQWKLGQLKKTFFLQNSFLNVRQMYNINDSEFRRKFLQRS